MWNWMVSALALGTTLVLYDGSPLHPHPAAMWDLVDACGITVFGTSAKWIAVQEDRGLKPRISHNLKTLKVRIFVHHPQKILIYNWVYEQDFYQRWIFSFQAILSTGSPLKPNSYEYVYRDIKVRDYSILN